MTVISRPALGQVACTASAAMSIRAQTSLSHNCSLTSGLSPEAWKLRATSWPSPYLGSVDGSALSAGGTTTTTTATTTTSGNRASYPSAGGSTTSGSGITYSGASYSGTSYSGTSYSGASYSGTGSSTTATSGTSSQESTPFHCPTTGLGGRVFANHSMLEVIDLTRGGLDSLGRYVVAALLNARSGRTPMLSETTVRAMWNDLINRGYYEPTAGIRWGAADIVAYIKTTIA